MTDDKITEQGAMREAFEAWATNFSLITDRHPDGRYTYPHTQTGWSAWQAAQARPVDAPTDAERLREALNDAATSLETISRLAGRSHYVFGDERVETYMGHFDEVRAYASARAGQARAAMRATPADDERIKPIAGIIRRRLHSLASTPAPVKDVAEVTNPGLKRVEWENLSPRAQELLSKRAEAIRAVGRDKLAEVPLAAQGAPVIAEAASLETALVTQFGSTTEYDELICAIWAAQPHYFRNREQSLEKARGLLAAATRKGQA